MAADTNGGYKIFNVFGTGFLKIVNDFYMQGKISQKAYNIEKDASFNFLIPYAYRLVVEHQNSNFLVEDAWPTINQLFGKWRVKKSLINLLIRKSLRSFLSILRERLKF